MQLQSLLTASANTTGIKNTPHCCHNTVVDVRLFLIKETSSGAFQHYYSIEITLQCYSSDTTRNTRNADVAFPIQLIHNSSLHDVVEVGIHYHYTTDTPLQCGSGVSPLGSLERLKMRKSLDTAFANTVHDSHGFSAEFLLTGT